ncbi:NAD-dependent epimerase/dehydratase family protein [Cyclobacterium jeungdonense]|uniref:NAD-dependent epimerase/dehydratase family protein n=1 Tax=Cyclobacterium jeungdonense TaxID=708087 RepID=A0ABT8CCD5_9BACT|nr:NAD-dependent epimerase/dehydratase family protein [Cyclobacterium jeungdonense]MDN3689478.1 NAD-dependent epimerase/dehydratase family protein [Cyclobacterium jeungdonense]
MIKFLITGSTGFLGKLLVAGNPDSFLPLEDKSTGARIDISKPFSIPYDTVPDVIIHAAGKAHTVPGNAAEEQAFFKVNLEGTQNLCRALERLSSLPKAFIFISTVAVYGRSEGKLLSEDISLDGKTPYAKSKLLAEEWLTQWAKGKGVVLGIVRLPLVVGPHPPGNLGAMISGIRSGKYLRIGKATARKSMVLAEDIPAILPKLAQVGGIYNLTDGYHPSFRELEETICRVLQKPHPREIPLWLAKGLGRVGDLFGPNFKITSDKVAKITSDLTFDDTLAREKLGWKPRRVLDVLPSYL